MMRLRAKWVLGLGVLCAMLAIAPGNAIAGKKKRSYEGPVATQGVQGQPPTIRIKIQFERNDDGKLVPGTLANLQHRAIALFCPNGTVDFAGPSSIETGAIGGFAKPGFTPFKRVRRGQLNLTLTGEDADSGGTADLLQLKARIPRKGAVTGTIHIVANNPFRGGNCDSGVVSFNAPQVASFSGLPS
jgi:hypothetical protein